MSSTANDNYLETEVLTAAPQKLHLMLIEAAMRSIERTRKAWEEKDYEEGYVRSSHAKECVIELINHLNKDDDRAKRIAKLVGNLASIYVFVFRTLTEANLTHDTAKLDDALRVLREEQVTWREVCKQFGSTQSGGQASTRFDSDAGGMTTTTTAPGTDDVDLRGSGADQHSPLPPDPTKAPTYGPGPAPPAHQGPTYGPPNGGGFGAGTYGPPPGGAPTGPAPTPNDPAKTPAPPVLPPEETPGGGFSLEV